MKPFMRISIITFLVCFFISKNLGAEVSLDATGGLSSQAVAKPLILLFLLIGITLLPFILMMTTSFVKIATVLALVRNGLGTQQIPPNTIITGLAMILTIYVMIPVGIDMYNSAGATINKGTDQPLLSGATMQLVTQAIGEAQEPLRGFLVKHAHAKELDLFLNLAKKMRKPEDRDKLTDKNFEILIPSFVISELSEAFQIGFVIFLPFLVLDVVVTNILLSLGMFQVSPVTVAMPFKLLLFVMVDGWHLIAKGLVLGYT